MSSSNSTEIKETLNVLHEMSNILDTGLDKETLSILVSLTEKGINPEALATVVEELRREASANKGKEKPWDNINNVKYKSLYINIIYNDFYPLNI